MKATFTLVKKTDLQTLIEKKDKNAIMDVIAIKEQALEEALENVEFYRSINNTEFADNEQVRVNRLMKDVNNLKAAI